MLYKSIMTNIKIKIRTYSNKVYTNFRGLNVPEADIECECFCSDLYWFFTCIQQEILFANIFRQL